MEGIITAWGKILRGYRPSLSIEITRECPLRCPGCYAYGEDHLGGDVNLRQVTDYKGQELIDRLPEREMSRAGDPRRPSDVSADLVDLTQQFGSHRQREPIR